LDAYRARLLTKSHSELLSIVSSFDDRVPASTPPDRLIRRILDYYDYSPQPAPPPRRQQDSVLIGPLLLLGIASAFAIIFCVIFITKLVLWRPIPVCDSRPRADCRPCPDRANCSDGRISCPSGFVAVENLCVPMSDPMPAVLAAVLRSTATQAGRFRCGLERRDSLSLDEIEAIVIDMIRNTTEAVRIFPEVVALLNTTASGIQIRQFGKSKFFVSTYPSQPHLCAAYSALKTTLIVAGLATVCLIGVSLRKRIAEIWCAARDSFHFYFAPRDFSCDSGRTFR
jgi:hypothetical protein